MKKFIFFSIALLYLSINGQSQIQLIGARYNSGSNSIELVKWQALNPSTAEIFPTLLEAYLYGTSVYDAYNSTYYLPGYSATGYGLFAHNTVTDAQAMYAFSGISNISEFDMSTGKIYTLNADLEGYITVNEIDVNSGSNILLGTIYEPGIMGLVADAISFDSNNGILYYVGYDATSSMCLYSIPVRDDEFSFTKTTLITTAPGNNITGVAFDNVNNTLYAMNAEYTASGNYTGNKVVEIDIATGEVHTRAALTGYTAFLGGSSAFDQNSGSYILVGFTENGAEDMIVFDTYQNTFETGPMPGLVSEIVCDNSVFARNAYVTTSAAEHEKANFSVYPNPADTKITLKTRNGSDAGTLVSIYTLTGKLVLQERISFSDQAEFDVSALTPGIYTLKTEMPDAVETHKIVIR